LELAAAAALESAAEPVRLSSGPGSIENHSKAREARKPLSEAFRPVDESADPIRSLGKMRHPIRLGISGKP